MIDEPKADETVAGLTFAAWNKTNRHDESDVARCYAHYLRRWRAGLGAMPPPQRPRTPNYDRYGELD